MMFPHNHYWDNGADVFSSARQQRVPYSDAAYQAWLAAGGAATRDPGDAELRDVLEPYGIGLTPAETAALQIAKALTPARAALVLAALTIRASDRWAALSVARKARVQAIINDGADAAIARLS